MFAGGWGSGGRDHFDTGCPLYRLVRELADMRRKHECFRRGKLAPLYGASAGPGPLAYRLDGAAGERAITVYQVIARDAADVNDDSRIDVSDAIVALGLTLEYGILHIPNFAHGALYMVGAYLTFYSPPTWGLTSGWP
jgi:hypothetical protein